MFLTIY